MDEIIAELGQIASNCEQAADVFKTNEIKVMCNNLFSAIRRVEKSFSGSWIGYHSKIYIEGFDRPQYKEFFDRNLGFQQSILNNTSGRWRQYAYDDVEQEIFRLAKVKNIKSIEDAAKQTEDIFNSGKNELLPILDALVDRGQQTTIVELRTKLIELNCNISINKIIKEQSPETSIMMSRDESAMLQGQMVPLHIIFEARLLHHLSYELCISILAEIARHVESYLKRLQ